jgi:hypothetical protein
MITINDRDVLAAKQLMPGNNKAFVILYLWRVVKSPSIANGFLNEYVVHNYNATIDDTYNGYYTTDYAEALRVFNERSY